MNLSIERNPEEIEFYQTRILRVFRQGRGNICTPISRELAEERLLRDAQHIFELGILSGEADLFAKLALERAAPYLSGKRGDFYSIRDFRAHAFVPIIRRLYSDTVRKRANHTNNPKGKLG